MSEGSASFAGLRPIADDLWNCSQYAPMTLDSQTVACDSEIVEKKGTRDSELILFLLLLLLFL